MGGSRASWILIVAGAAVASALSSCTPGTPPAPEGPAEAAAAAPAPDAVPPAPVDVAAEAVPEAAGAACYIKDGAGWLLIEGGREATCFQRDNCSGGLGGDTQPRGTCLKWAVSPDAPALPWSMALTNPKLADDVRPPMDIYEGSYEMTSDCHEKGCAYGSSRFSADTPIYTAADARTPVIATVPAGECVLTETDKLMQAPRRGVVLETLGRFTAGDVIYLTAYEGEGFSTVWRRGEYLDGFQDEVVVRWDKEKPHPLAGYWLEITRPNGQRGWARDPDPNERGCDPRRP